MGTGEDIPADELRKSLKQVLYNDSGVTYTKDGEIVINGSVVRKGNPVYDAIVNPEIYDPKFVDDVPMGFKTHREVEQETQKDSRVVSCSTLVGNLKILSFSVIPMGTLPTLCLTI